MHDGDMTEYVYIYLKLNFLTIVRDRDMTQYVYM